VASAFDDALQLCEPAPRLLERLRERARLLAREVLGVADHDRALAAVERAPGAVGRGAVEALERPEAGALDGEQVGMVGGHERADDGEPELVGERLVGA
jgi:hypothetical protein